MRKFLPVFYPLFLFILLSAMASCGSNSSTSSSDDSDAGEEVDNGDDTDDGETEDSISVSSISFGDTSLVAGSSVDLDTVPSSFNLSFSSAANADTVSEGISLDCGEEIALTVAVSGDDADDGISNNDFTITPANIPIPELSSCTLTLADTISTTESTSALSHATMLSSTSYDFTTPCSTSDYFSNFFQDADTLSECWSQNNASNWTTSIEDDVLGLSVANGSTATLAGLPVIYKSLSSESIVVFMEIDEISGFAGDSGNLFVGVAEDATNLGGGWYYFCSIELNGDEDSLEINSFTSGDATATEDLSGATSTTLSEINSGKSLTVRVIKEDDSFSCAYQWEGDEAYDAVNTVDDTVSPTDEYDVFFGLTKNNSSNSVLIEINSVYTTQSSGE